jgi:hypothetical protein
MFLFWCTGVAVGNCLYFLNIGHCEQRTMYTYMYVYGYLGIPKISRFYHSTQSVSQLYFIPYSTPKYESNDVRF